jgi:pyruvate dehydrogenase E1 component
MTQKPADPTSELLNSIIGRVHAHAMSMIYLANHRDNIEKGDPKVGGHPTASSSALHLLSCLHLVTKTAADYIACKPHASPADHANNYLMRLFFEPDGSRMSDERARIAMRNLRHFSTTGEPVFQSYHSVVDPDHWGQLPSGSVGIPPVNAAYLAHAYRMAEIHGHKVPKDAQFWCIMGDSEYREGSLAEVLPEVAERGLGNVTWIVDYNRQSLDGHRILNEGNMGGKDNDRIDRTAQANGWDTLQLRHGRFRERIFADGGTNGEALREVIEQAIPDYEFQSLLAGQDPKAIVEALSKYDSGAGLALKSLDAQQVLKFFNDLGAHDTDVILEALEQSKRDREKPMLIVQHSIKGWHLRSAAKSANHSAMMTEEEVLELRAKNKLSGKDITAFERFDEQSSEGKYLKARGDTLAQGMADIEKQKQKNIEACKKLLQDTGALSQFPTEVGINLKLVPLAHTQWMLGQITAKLARIADTSVIDSEVNAPAKALTAEEKKLKLAASMLFTMAPDVGTSTNLNASMDGRIFGPEADDFEKQYGVKDTKSPDIVPHESAHSRFVRFDIAEGNTMSCMGSYGKMGDFTGVPMMPVMTVYDFFLKRALDQLFYNLYWNSSFICVGTPSGVTLSPEGAQHGWKSDIQIANILCWEPAFAIELDWIITESLRRHVLTFIEGPDSPNSNTGRSGVVIRGVTRALDQKELVNRLRTHKRFAGLSEADILDQTRRDCLEGAYWLVDHRGSEGYRPSENVVHIFSMGSLVTEALAASDKLKAQGIFANVIQVTSNDLLLGNQGEKSGYKHLKQGLGIRGDLLIKLGTGQATDQSYPPLQFGPTPGVLSGAAGTGQIVTLGGRRIPIVSVHDGEPGLLDNIGSALGTLQKSLAVRKHSKSGRPSDIYKYHGLDADSIAKASKEILVESAYSEVKVDAATWESAQSRLPSAEVTSAAKNQKPSA